MNLSLAQLHAAMPYAGAALAIHLPALNGAMEEFQIDSLISQAMFLAQVAHETASLKYAREIADGSAYDPEMNPELAERLGNTQPGDGKRFPGRGDLMVTGRANTLKCLAALGRPQADTAYLETPIGAARSAGWFWKTHGLNESAMLGNFGSNTRRLNGGYNGLDERIKHYIRCRKALGL